LNRPWVAAAGDEPIRQFGELPAPLTIVRF